MFNSSNEPAVASEMVSCSDERETAPHAGDLVAKTGTVMSIDMRSLAPGTAVVVVTRNSHYRFVMLDGKGGTALVQGGAYFPHETIARIEGSTLGASFVMAGRIDLGLSLELSFRGDRIVTTSVQSINVDAFAEDDLRSSLNFSMRYRI